MSAYVAFIRAINVAGHPRIRMNAVRDAFAAAGCRQVRTYIHSGNVIFDSPGQERARLLEKVRARLGCMLHDECDIMLRSARWVQDLVKAAPFKDVESGSGTKLYVAFLSRRPRIKLRLPLVSSTDALEIVAASGNEAFVISRRKENGFFGFPNNFVEKEFGVPATSRNWSTITRIVRLLRTEADETILRTQRHKCDWT
jgi:uncharacterized protein (DUF1697 family)